MLTLLSPDGTRVPAAETAPGANPTPGAASDHVLTPLSGHSTLPGTATPHPDRLEAYAAELTPDRLREAYRRMMRVRAFDQ